MAALVIDTTPDAGYPKWMINTVYGVSDKISRGYITRNDKGIKNLDWPAWNDKAEQESIANIYDIREGALVQADYLSSKPARFQLMVRPTISATLKHIVIDNNIVIDSKNKTVTYITGVDDDGNLLYDGDPLPNDIHPVIKKEYGKYGRLIATHIFLLLPLFTNNPEQFPQYQEPSYPFELDINSSNVKYSVTFTKFSKGTGENVVVGAWTGYDALTANASYNAVFAISQPTLTDADGLVYVNNNGIKDMPFANGQFDLTAYNFTSISNATENHWTLGFDCTADIVSIEPYWTIDEMIDRVTEEEADDREYTFYHYLVPYANAALYTGDTDQITDASGNAILTEWHNIWNMQLVSLYSLDATVTCSMEYVATLNSARDAIMLTSSNEWSDTTYGYTTGRLDVAYVDNADAIKAAGHNVIAATVYNYWYIHRYNDDWWWDTHWYEDWHAHINKFNTMKVEYNTLALYPYTANASNDLWLGLQTYLESHTASPYATLLVGENLTYNL
jgi:hypothetical protein